MDTCFGSRRRRRGRVVAGVALVIVVALASLFSVAGFFNREAISVIPAGGRRSPVGALFFSGDMGLHYGLGYYTSNALARHGVTVVGANSPTLFGTHRTQAEVNAIVADAVGEALAKTGSGRIVAIGQSYGADVLQSGLAALPVALRARIASVVLVVPGETVFFRADPSGIAYHGTPDAAGVESGRTLGWAPLTCIYGLRETDSLCPHLHMANVRVVGMPGGHFLNRDTDAAVGQVLAAIARDVPGAFAAR